MDKITTKKVGMISLGCDKNRVDSEKVLYAFVKNGWTVVGDAAEADVILINTCAFIDSAKQESIDTILEFSKYKEGAPKKKLIVLGCLAERYGKELAEAMPEVDTFVGINGYDDIVKTVESEEKLYLPKDSACYEEGRIVTTPAHYAYLKIADGCDNFCTYCAIPYIRGRYRSYPKEKLLAEAEKLAKDGVKELIIVAQDTTRYGKDLYGYYALKDLLRELMKLDFCKIRLLYAYPELIDDELIHMLATEDKLAKYVDIPLQHIDDGVLKRMNRRSRETEIRDLLKKIRLANPEIAVRSSFIVGFPAETEEEFQKLKEFIAEGAIDYAGFFKYSKEEGTVAAKMKGQVSARAKKEREKELYTLQTANIIKGHQRYADKIVPVIYEGIDYKRQLFYGRTERNAPEIDTKVFFSADFTLEIGEIYNVKITSCGFDLEGEATGD